MLEGWSDTVSSHAGCRGGEFPLRWIDAIALTCVLAPVFVRISPLAKAGVQGFMKKLRKESQT